MNYKNFLVGNSQVSKIYFGSKENPIWSKGSVEHDLLCFTAEEAGSTIGLEQKNSSATLKYSFDKEDWTELTTEDTITLENIGDKVYFRGTSTSVTGEVYEDYTQFTMTGEIAASGSIMSILCDDPNATVLPHDLCCYKMFYRCYLTKAPELPATTLTYACYEYMFYETDIVTAPALPATTLAEECYCQMFQYCYSLTTAPALPATVLADYCYYDMFEGCESLTTAPHILPATTMVYECCYGMFASCYALTTVPELPATTLAEGCYEWMFYGCHSLTTAPELPATTLAEECYKDMFRECESLTTVPELPAITLADYCYNQMFRDCSNIKLSETKTEEYQTEYRIPTNGQGVNAEGALVNMFYNTGGTFTDSPQINKTYYGAW